MTVPNVSEARSTTCTGNNTVPTISGVPDLRSPLSQPRTIPETSKFDLKPRTTQHCIGWYKTCHSHRDLTRDDLVSDGNINVFSPFTLWKTPSTRNTGPIQLDFQIQDWTNFRQTLSRFFKNNVLEEKDLDRRMKNLDRTLQTCECVLEGMQEGPTENGP